MTEHNHNSDNADATSTTTTTDASSCTGSPPPGRKCVSFGVIRVREHERILIDGADNDVYACLAIGWGHKKSSHRCLVDDLEEAKKSSSASSPTDSCPSQRHSASERVKVLNEYGFPLQEVMRNEAIKKKKSCALRRAYQNARSSSSSSSSCRRGGIRGLFGGWGSRKKIL